MRTFLFIFLISGTLLGHPLPSFNTKEYKQVFSFGLKRDPVKFKAFKKGFPHKFKKNIAVTVPGKLDLSAKVSPPENQGSCGSCWDFSITKALRSAWMLIGKDPGTLAFNYLLNNCGGVVNESGCGGGDFDAGQNDTNKLGPWLEVQDPYTQSEGNCMQGLAVAATAVTWTLVGDGNNPPTFQELAGALIDNHMLSIDVAVCGEWSNYSGGIFDEDQCGAERINHMINLNGYDCETSVDAAGNCLFNASGQPANGDGFLIVMNNWGTGWGENGYMRSRWGVDALADTAMFFTVAGTPPTPPVPVPPPPAPKWHGFLCGVLHFLPWCSFN